MWVPHNKLINCYYMLILPFPMHSPNIRVGPSILFSGLTTALCRLSPSSPWYDKSLCRPPLSNPLSIISLGKRKARWGSFRYTLCAVRHLAHHVLLTSAFPL